VTVEIDLLERLKEAIDTTKSTGTVNTNGTAVTWVSGDKFDSRWVNQPVTIDGAQYAVQSVADDENLVLWASAGVQAGAGYAFYRVYGKTAPQNVIVPYILYFKTSPSRDYTHDGFSGLHRPRIQISCFANTYGQVKAMAKEVVEAVEAWSPPAFVAGEQDMFEEDTGLYHVPVDFFIHYED